MAKQYEVLAFRSDLMRKYWVINMCWIKCWYLASIVVVRLYIKAWCNNQPVYSRSMPPIKTDHLSHKWFALVQKHWQIARIFWCSCMSHLDFAVGCHGPVLRASAFYLWVQFSLLTHDTYVERVNQGSTKRCGFSTGSPGTPIAVWLYEHNFFMIIKIRPLAVEWHVSFSCHFEQSRSNRSRKQNCQSILHIFTIGDWV